MKSAAIVALVLISLTTALFAEEDAAKAAAKPAPPSVSAVAAATKTVKETYKDIIVGLKSKQAKMEFVQKLFEAVPGETSDAAIQYAIIDLARQYCFEQVDIEGAMNTIALTDQYFKVEPLKMKFDALMALSKAIKDNDARKDFVVAAAAVIDESIAKDRYDFAKPLSVLYNLNQHTLGDFTLTAEATTRMAQLKDCDIAFNGGAKRAAATIADKPTDPDANTTLGKYTALLKGDWDAGLHMLAAGSNDQLKALANKDLLAKTDPEIADAADGWYDFWDKANGTTKEMTRKHALELYDKCVNSLSGMAKTRGENRQRALQPVRVGVVVVEAFIEGGSTLHVTKQGIYWSHNGDRAKPGKADGQDLPTYINNKEWMPAWGKPNDNKAYDKSAVLPLDMGNYSIDLQVVAMGSKRGAKDRATYYMPTSNTSENETTIYCSYSSSYSSSGTSTSAPAWYTFEITPKSKAPAGAWKSIAGTYEASFNIRGSHSNYTYNIDDQGKVSAVSSNTTYRGRSYSGYSYGGYSSRGQMVKQGDKTMIDFGYYVLVFGQNAGGITVSRYPKDGNNISPTMEYSGTFTKK